MTAVFSAETEVSVIEKMDDQHALIAVSSTETEVSVIERRRMINMR